MEELSEAMNIQECRYVACTVQSAFGSCIFRELNAVAGAVTITCLMVCIAIHSVVKPHKQVANRVGFVIGPSNMNLFISRFLQKQGLSLVSKSTEEWSSSEHIHQNSQWLVNQVSDQLDLRDRRDMLLGRITIQEIDLN